jgi:hypothetical protein
MWKLAGLWLNTITVYLARWTGFGSSRNFDPRFSCRRPAAIPPASKKTPSSRKDGSALSMASQLRYHLDTFPLFRWTTFNPLTPSPKLHKQVINIAGAILWEEHRNEEQLPYENRLTIKSRTYCGFCIDRHLVSLEGKGRVYSSLCCGSVSRVSPHTPLHVLLPLSLAPIRSSWLEGPLAYLIVVSFLPTPVSFPPPI